MTKTILLTGATDGIGLATARMLIVQGHTVLLHGRNQQKLEHVSTQLSRLPGAGKAETFVADLSKFTDVENLAQSISVQHKHLDGVINNAGVLKVSNPRTPDGLDVRFMVNAIAPFHLTQRLMPLMGPSSRVVNVSSAAQAPVHVEALVGAPQLPDMAAYAQSKLAITMWSFELARTLGPSGPLVIAVNPGSLLATKMVRTGFGIQGSDVDKGATILTRLTLDDEFSSASGKYFDNDAGRFAEPHSDARSEQKRNALVGAIEQLIAQHVGAQ